MRAVVLMIGDPRYQSVWHRLPESVTTGEAQAEAVHGVSMWEPARPRPRLRRHLQRGDVAAHRSRLAHGRCSVRLHPLPADRRCRRRARPAARLDARRRPGRRGVLLEQESLLRDAEERLREAGVLARCRLEGGSFFDQVPRDGDLYVLRRVLHDFDDDQALAVLDTVRRDMPDDATLLLMESVVPPGGGPDFAKNLDLDMLLFVGGRERTEEEYAALLGRAGFALTRVVPTISPISLVEARPAA